MSMRYGPVELSVPPGFQNILHLISQEVLRSKPAKPYEFIAEFIDDLLAIREESGYDPVTQGDMIHRVQEQYWRVQRERRNSNLNAEELMKKTQVGSGDKGHQPSLSDNAEALVTIAMHQENGEGIEHDEAYQGDEQQDVVAKQHDTTSDEQERDDLGNSINEEGEQVANLNEGLEEKNDEQNQAMGNTSKQEMSISDEDANEVVDED